MTNRPATLPHRNRESVPADGEILVKRTIVVVMAALLGLTACGGSSSGSNDIYDSVYSSFATELKSGANWAAINGVTYASQCREYWSLELLTQNFSESDETDYVRACVAAHRGVFGSE